jgi:hypothetical protein
MYDKGVSADLIKKYRLVSLLMHKSESKVENFENPVKGYLNDCKTHKNSLKNLVDPIQGIIQKYYNLTAE